MSSDSLIGGEGAVPGWHEKAVLQIRESGMSDAFKRQGFAKSGVSATTANRKPSAGAAQTAL